MPIFEYKCRDCNSVFEKLINGNMEDEIICPECNSKNIEKQLSSFSTSSGNHCHAKSTCEAIGHQCCNSGKCPLS